MTKEAKIVRRWQGKLPGRLSRLKTAKAKESYWRSRHMKAANARTRKMLEEARSLVAIREDQLSEAHRVIARHRPKASSLWGGSRQITDEIINFVDGRYRVTSRKRSELFGNPGSDHHILSLTADAVDFATNSNYKLGSQIAAHLGGSWSADFQSFFIWRNGKRYRVQIIAGTHGTGPHLHVGVKRA